MKSADEELWREQRLELQSEQVSRDFLEFIECWVDRAEELLDNGMDSPAEALRQALRHADETLGRVSVHFLGQMLVVIGTHWKHGDQMMTGLSSIELRLVQDMLALKFAELQRQAADSE